MSDSLVIWWSRLLATSATARCSSLLSPLPCKCFGIGSYEVEYDFSFVLQGALVWALGSTAWLHTVWSEAEWASWSEVLRNEKNVLFFDNKEATTFGRKEKSLLLDDKRSLYFCHLTILLRCQWTRSHRGNNNVDRIWASKTKNWGRYLISSVFSVFRVFFWSRSLSKLQQPGSQVTGCCLSEPICFGL